MKIINILAILILLTVTACSARSSRALSLSDYTGRVGMASGDLTPDELVAQIPFMQKARLAISLNPANFGFSLWVTTQLTIELLEYDIPTILFVVPATGPDGSIDFSHQDNAEETKSVLYEIMDYIEANDLPDRILLIDMEPPVALFEDIGKVALQWGITGVVDYLVSRIDREGFKSAKGIYTEMVDEAHRRGFYVIVTALPPVLDDFSDGDDSLQMIMRTPVDGIPWDMLVFQVYRPIFIRAAEIGGFPSDFTPYLIYSYAQTALQRYGTRAGIALGTVSDSLKNCVDDPSTLSLCVGYTEPEGLLADVDAALSAGMNLEQISYFAFSGVVRKQNPEDWIPDGHGSGIAPEPDSATDAMRNLFKLIDLAVE